MLRKRKTQANVLLLQSNGSCSWNHHKTDSGIKSTFFFFAQVYIRHTSLAPQVLTRCCDIFPPGCCRLIMTDLICSSPVLASCHVLCMPACSLKRHSPDSPPPLPSPPNLTPSFSLIHWRAIQLTNRWRLVHVISEYSVSTAEILETRRRKIFIDTELDRFLS